MLVAIHSKGKTNAGNRKWICQCDCGNYCVVASGDLRSNNSCGCKRRKKSNKNPELHRKSREPLYDVWSNILRRCFNTNGYKQGLQIDREDNNGNYEPGNCRWVTNEVNANNKRNTKIITAFGETKTLTDWLADERCLAPRYVISYRIAQGWSPEKALTTPAILGRNQFS